MLTELTQWAPSLNGWSGITAIAGTVFLLFTILQFRSSNDGGPPELSETIPFLSNSIALITDIESFWNRCLKAMRSLDTDIMRLRLGRRRVYLVVGENKTNPLFRISSGLTSHAYVALLCDVMFGPPKKDLARFAGDISGRGKEPAPGTEHIQDRIWLKWHTIFAKHLLRTRPTNDLATWFLDRFSARITELFPLGKPSDILVWNFIHRHVTECAGRALVGDGVFDFNGPEDYISVMSKYDLSIAPMAFGPPRWLNPKPYSVRERWLRMNKRYFTQALQDYDWENAPKDNSWEPVLGSPLIRAMARWALDDGFDVETVAAMCGQQVSNQNSNSVPAAAWAILDSLMCPDPELLPNLRREAEAATTVTDATTGREIGVDFQKLVSSPWLQAVYTEVLRLRVVFSLVRDAERDTEIDGFAIPRGSQVQAPVPLAHRNEAVWGVEGHPADEFWPRRNLTLTTGEGDEKKKKKWEFAAGGRSGYWFPYGGGNTICPGRHFAKQEIIAVLALFLTRFEADVIGWMMPDGVTKSERVAKNGDFFVVSRPDRDLKVRVTRK